MVKFKTSLIFLLCIFNRIFPLVPGAAVRQFQQCDRFYSFGCNSATILKVQQFYSSTVFTVLQFLV